MSYAIVDNQDYTSIFTAAAFAVVNGIYIAVKTRQRIVICTDSLSVLKSVSNPANQKWHTINEIRDLLTNHYGTLSYLDTKAQQNKRQRPSG